MSSPRGETLVKKNPHVFGSNPLSLFSINIAAGSLWMELTTIEALCFILF